DNWMRLIHVAARYGNLELVKLLWEQGLSFSVQDSRRWTPLTYAVMYDHTPVVDFIHEKNPDIIKQKTIENVTMLHVAVCINLKIAKKVYGLFPDALDAVDSRGNTPLLRALVAGHYDVAEWLLTIGANATCKNKDGRTPLSITQDN